MLSAACPGEVFTSPVPDQMLRAAAAVNSGAGVLFIVKNYTGDVLNFRMAAELSEDDGIDVATVVMDDDCAVQDSLYTAGRRGTGATVLAEKIAGAKAEAGGSLADVAGICRKVNEQGRSFGVALTSCATPSSGTPIFDLGPDEIEVGVGIHGEPGRRREKMKPAAELAEEMLEPIVSDLELAKGDSVLAFVNGLGGTPLIELYIAYADVAEYFAERGVRIARNLVGNYITSLEMAGVSLTVCKADEQMLALWDAPVNTPALRWGV